MGREFKGKGINFARGFYLFHELVEKLTCRQVGPAVDPLTRAPEGGRNWEAFGGDPVLSAFAGAQTIGGMQDAGVIAVRTRAFNT